DYANALHGLTFAKTETEMSEGIANARQELEDLNDEYQRLAKLSRDAQSTNPLKSLSASAQLFNEGLGPVAVAGGAANKGAYDLLRRQNVLTEAIAEKERDLKLAIEERQRQEEKDRLNPLPGLGGTDKPSG